MDSLFLQNIKKQVADWRAVGYKGVEKETLNILGHIKRVGFLHEPQVEALENIYLSQRDCWQQAIGADIPPVIRKRAWVYSRSRYFWQRGFWVGLR